MPCWIPPTTGHSFLSLWSYPHPQRNTTPVSRELCDVLVVFGDDVILFSDKSIAFPAHEDLQVAWGRWYRAAVMDSAKQLFGASRWLREQPHRVFADVQCTQPLGAPLPHSVRARYHLVAVAWGAGDACQAFYGPQSSRSLMINSNLVGPEHLDEPFSIGRIDARRSFVHVFDELSLQLVMNEIDTAPDFVEYLNKRVALLTTPGRTIIAPGEEELLASYLTHLDENGTHSFLAPGESVGFDGVAFGEGGWSHYVSHPQRQAKVNANKISYIWDHLLEHLIKELPERSNPQATGDPATMNREAALRVMASESRLSRRMLGRHLDEAMRRTSNLRPRQSLVRVGFIQQRPHTAYLFLILAPDPSRSQQEYQLARNNMLTTYCNVLAVEMPEVHQIVGIAMTPPGWTPASEALCFMRNEHMTDEFRNEVRRIQAELNILVNFRNRALVDHDQEYPE
jgi:hypothetical protein